MIEVLSVCFRLFSAFIWCKYTKKMRSLLSYFYKIFHPTQSNNRFHRPENSFPFFVPSYNKTNNTGSQISRKSLIKFQCPSWDYPSFCSGVIRKSFAQKKVKKVSLSSMETEESERKKKKVCYNWPESFFLVPWMIIWMKFIHHGSDRGWNRIN